jgi:hypothetical protein
MPVSGEVFLKAEELLVRYNGIIPGIRDWDPGRRRDPGNPQTRS